MKETEHGNRQELSKKGSNDIGKRGGSKVVCKRIRKELVKKESLKMRKKFGRKECKKIKAMGVRKDLRS